MKKLLLLSLLLLSATQAKAQTDQRLTPFPDIQKEVDAGMPPHIGLSREASEIMFDRQNHVTDKAAQQLKMRQNGTLKDNKLTIGGPFNGTVISERTNTDGKFPILS